MRRLALAVPRMSGIFTAWRAHASSRAAVGHMTAPRHRIGACAAAVVLTVLPLSALPALAQTVPGIRVGLEGGAYLYQENNPGSASNATLDSQNGPNVGLLASDTWVFKNVFVTVDARLADALTRYTSPGLKAINSVWTPVGEVRGVAGTDLAATSSIVVSPYAGLGYRGLYNNLDGGRYEQYLYLPVGVSAGIAYGAMTLRPTVEFDGLLAGFNTTDLANVGYSNNIQVQQTSGYGLRASFNVETDTTWGKLSLGPFVRYWNINQSSTSYATGSSCFGHAAPCSGTVARLGFVEPQNMTTETGLSVSLRF